MRKSKLINPQSPSWVQGELRLAGSLDSRMISLLSAIDETGSINQAAKQMDLSYKGAWQMIERANNMAPKTLISTATGGSKGGGTCLTTAGKALLKLFTQLDERHQAFLHELNRDLEADSDMLLLLKPLAIKTSATNQLFGTIVSLQLGSVYAEVAVELKWGEKITVSLTMHEIASLNLAVGSSVLVLISAPEISLVVIDQNNYRLSSRNCLNGTVIRIKQDGVDSEVVVRTSSGDCIVAMITKVSTDALELKIGSKVNAIFKSNAVTLGAIAK